MCQIKEKKTRNQTVDIMADCCTCWDLLYTNNKRFGLCQSGVKADTLGLWNRQEETEEEATAFLETCWSQHMNDQNHPDTKPLTPPYQTKQTQNTHTRNTPETAPFHLLPRSSGVRIIQDCGILSASAPSNTHLNIFPGVLRLFPYHSSAVALS